MLQILVSISFRIFWNHLRECFRKTVGLFNCHLRKGAARSRQSITKLSERASRSWIRIHYLLDMIIKGLIDYLIKIVILAHLGSQLHAFVPQELALPQLHSPEPTRPFRMMKPRLWILRNITWRHFIEILFFDEWLVYVFLMLYSTCEGVPDGLEWLYSVAMT